MFQGYYGMDSIILSLFIYLIIDQQTHVLIFYLLVLLLRHLQMIINDVYYEIREKIFVWIKNIIQTYQVLPIK